MSLPPRTALILGAGLGTRMGRLTESTPKPLLAVGGKALLDHAIDRSIEAGVERVVVNVHAHAEMMRSHLARRADIPVSIAVERELLETGGGARNALPLIGSDPFLVLNSDAIWTEANPLAPLLDAWTVARSRLHAMLLLLPLQQCESHRGAGDFLLGADGSIRRANGAPGALVYAGAQIISSNALAQVPRGVWSFNRWWDELIATNRIRGVSGRPGRWIDVGTPEGLATANGYLNPG